jgi:hypothetical protein
MSALDPTSTFNERSVFIVILADHPRDAVFRVVAVIIGHRNHRAIVSDAPQKCSTDE